MKGAVVINFAVEQVDGELKVAVEQVDGELKDATDIMKQE